MTRIASFYASHGVVISAATGPMSVGKAKLMLDFYVDDAARPTVSEALAEHDLEMARQLTAAIREVQPQSIMEIAA